MELKYKRKHNDSFMLIDVEAEPIKHEQMMIEENCISSLLSFSKVQIDGSAQYWYDISKKEALIDYIENEGMSRNVLEKIIIHMHLCLEELNRYLIDVNHIIFTSETVYVEKASDGFKMQLCYCPDMEVQFQEQFRNLYAEILKHVDATDQDFAELAYALYDKTQKEDYTLMELVEALHIETENEIEVTKVYLDDDQEDEKVSVKGEEFLSDYYDEPEDDIWDKLRYVISNIFSKKKERENLVEVAKDFIVEPDVMIGEPTVLLTDENTIPIGKLVYDGNRHEENILINKDMFKIGNEAGNNDGVINSRAVSRHHARIRRENNLYFLSDMNSTNGTYINGKLLPYKQEHKLKPMDTIVFADAAYVFM